MTQMKTELHIDVSFEQLLNAVTRLPKQQKIRLIKELEKDVIESKLSGLLKIFKNSELDNKTIAEEVALVRQKAYEKKKR